MIKLGENMDAVISEKLFSEFSSLSTEDWEKIIEKDLKGADYERKLIWKSEEELAIKPYYRKEDRSTSVKFGVDKKQNNSWLIEIEITDQDVKEANRKALKAIEEGATAICFDVEHLRNKDDFYYLLEGIDLDKTYLHFDSGKETHNIAEYFLKYAKENNADLNRYRGSFNFDPLSCLIKSGHFFQTKATDFLEAAELADMYAKNMPNCRTLTIGGHLIHGAGGNIVQEVAITLAMANEFLTQITSKGIDADTIASQIEFNFGIGSNYFFEIAKLRAVRSLWKAVINQYDIQKESSEEMVIHSCISSTNKSIYDAEVNILRATTEAMSAIIGGCDALTINPHDCIFKNSDEFSDRVAKNIHLVLKEEAYLDKVIDPSAGSYYIEKLTEEIADAAWSMFQEIEGMGGFIEAMKVNWIQKEIEKTVKKKDLDYATRRKIILGTNQYPKGNEEMLFEVDIDVYTSTPATTKTEQLLPLRPYRGAKLFESLRLKTEQYKTIAGSAPRVIALGLGQSKMRNARMDFAENFFGVVGYDVVKMLTDNIDETLATLKNQKVDVIVACAADEEYEEFMPKLGLQYGEDGVIVIAGEAKDNADQFKSYGVKYYINRKTNLIDSLNQFHKEVGIR